MQTIIKRGNVTIGSIHHEIPMLGMEVIVETQFPGADPDGDTQFGSFEKGENRLHLIYEAHCEAVGITPAARPAKPAEVDPEAEYLAREAQREADEMAHYEALMAEGIADETATKLTTAPTPPTVAGDDADDDFPF